MFNKNVVVSALIARTLCTFYKCFGISGKNHNWMRFKSGAKKVFEITMGMKNGLLDQNKLSELNKDELNLD